MVQRLPRKNRWTNLWIGILLAVFLILDLQGNSAQAGTQSNGGDSEYRSFLPVADKSDSFGNLNHPIWAHNEEPDAHEVVLFRQQFIVDEIAEDVDLVIFADTRYEVWIDGVWVGRGPARFSQVYREYDLYALDPLLSGEHLIAVLVQWAPNIRRSESSTPLLQAALSARVNGSYQTLLRTQAGWKILKSNAWQPDAVQVHAWNLIGPTELVDLRELPQDWMMPGFDDSGWSPSVIRNPYRQDYQALYRYPNDVFPQDGNEVLVYPHNTQSSTARAYAVRSIKLLDHEPIQVDIFDRGQLSPESSIVEIPAGTVDYELTFDVTEQRLFRLEMLMGGAVTPPGLITLDGKKLQWQAVGDQRPDVYFGTAPVPAGQHHLVISQIPADGITLGLPTDGVHWHRLPFDQGMNAGRRLLLADYVSDPESVYIFPWSSLSATFVEPPAYLVLDLGRTVHGRLTADVVGPSGTVLDIGWDERIHHNTRPLPFPGSFYPYWNQVDSWVLDGQKRSVNTIDARAGRYILIGVWGSEPVFLENIQVQEERFPFTQTGNFRSGEALLDKIWQVGVDTLYPTMTDGYADPWRERGQWWGDAYVANQANMVAFGDLDLVRRGLRLMADGFDDGQPTAMAPNGADVRMLDYGMLWLHSLGDYARWSDDWQLVHELYPTIRAFMNYLATTTNPSTGLIDLPVGPWSQTAFVDTYAYQSRFGQSAALNAMYYHTLLVAADLAEGLDQMDQADRWRTDAQLVKQMINATLFLPDEHRYVTSIRDGKVAAPSVYAQAWPLAYGIVPPGEEQAVADALLQLLPDDPATAEIGVYAMNWVLVGLGRAGRVQDALDLIRLYFGYMLDSGATTWWERFDANRFYSQSLAHGWGSSPTWFLSTYVLGAQRTGPNTWALKPDFESVKSASGSMPLQDGTLDVGWRNLDCAHVNISITVPQKSPGTIVLPWHDAVLTMDGEVIWNNDQAFSNSVSVNQIGINIALDEGDYDLSIAKPCLP